MQTEFNFHEDDEKNAITVLSSSSGPPLADSFVPVGQFAQAVIMRLEGGLPSIRCGRSKGGKSDRPRD